VRTTLADGTEALDQVPLTLEDVLHPEPGDVIVQTDPHDSDSAYLKSVSKARLSHDQTAVVLSDCGVDFNLPGVKHLVPDLALFFGVRRQRAWSIFDVAAEGARPAMVVEVTSPDTRSNDLEIKVDYYHRAGVPLYVIADVSKGKDGDRRIALIGYERAPRKYKRVKPDKQGRIWLAPVRLWLGLTRDRVGGFVRLACFDPDTGEEVGDYTAIAQELAAEKSRRLKAEAQAAAESRSRVVEKRRRLKAEARAAAEAQSRADEESRRLNAEARAAAESRARADAEERASAEARARAAAEERASEEARARALAEERVRILEAEMKRVHRRKS
jgi:Uma2 family endonuclease